MEPQIWDERYSKPEFVYGTEPNDFLVSVAGRLPPGPVLMLAEGEGRNAVFLAGLGYEVVAIDQSAVGLAKARRLAQERGVRVQTQQADLRDYPIQPGVWAGIVSIFLSPPPVDPRPPARGRRPRPATRRRLRLGGVYAAAVRPRDRRPAVARADGVTR